ncbi:MAG: DUF3276 family protein [Lentimicrobiaceae bacterium]|nr:DUF3276 family protein [Lentimicrobiaceae bacterium]
MEEFDNTGRKEEIYSLAIRAGKRTYFFDVKATRSNEYYLTITESKRKFNNEEGKFFYEKHKLFPYKEDFEKFQNGLQGVIEFIQTGKKPELPDLESGGGDHHESNDDAPDSHTDMTFEDLDLEGSPDKV